MFHVEHPSTANIKRLGGADPVRGPSHVPRGTSSSPVPYRNRQEPGVKIFHGVALPHQNPGVAPGGNVPRGTPVHRQHQTARRCGPGPGAEPCSTWNIVLAGSLPQQAGARSEDLPRGGAPPPESRSCARRQCSTWNTDLSGFRLQRLGQLLPLEPPGWRSPTLIPELRGMAMFHVEHSPKTKLEGPGRA